MAKSLFPLQQGGQSKRKKKKDESTASLLGVRVSVLIIDAGEYELGKACDPHSGQNQKPAVNLSLTSL